MFVDNPVYYIFVEDWAFCALNKFIMFWGLTLFFWSSTIAGSESYLNRPECFAGEHANMLFRKQFRNEHSSINEFTNPICIHVLICFNTISLYPRMCATSFFGIQFGAKLVAFRTGEFRVLTGERVKIRMRHDLSPTDYVMHVIILFFLLLVVQEKWTPGNILTK